MSQARHTSASQHRVAELAAVVVVVNTVFHERPHRPRSLRSPITRAGTPPTMA